MDITIILKLTGVGILVSVAAQILKKSGHDEQALIVTVAGIAVGLILTLTKLSEAVELVKSLFSL